MKLRTAFALMLVLVLLGASVPGLVEGGNTYTVQRGDSLSKIAAEHGVTVQELVRINADRYPSLKTNPGLIEPGWILVLPDTGAGETNNEKSDVLKQAITWVKTRAVPAVQKWSREVFKPSRLPASQTSGGSSGNAPQAMQIGDPAAEEEILRMFNEERQAKGLSALVIDEELRARACERTRDMFQRRYFSHYDPVTGKNLSEGAGGEILARGGSLDRSPVTLARGWWNSPEHYAIIVYPDWHRVGICPGNSGGIWLITAQFLP